MSAALHAAAAGAADGIARPSRARVGMACLLASETSFFLVFLVAHAAYRGRSLSGPQPAEVLATPVLGTICLLSSSATIALAVRALRAGRRGTFRAWWAATIALGAIFLVGTALEWRDLLARGLRISTNLFGTTFYSLVGLHALHVAVGIALLSIALALSLRDRLGPAAAERAEILSWYWHFVDTVWIAVLTSVYLVPG